MTQFVDGMFVKKDFNSPDFLLCKLSIKTPEFKQYLDDNANSAGYVNIDILKSKKGNVYASLNDWTPTKKDENNKKDEEYPPF